MKTQTLPVGQPASELHVLGVHVVASTHTGLVPGAPQPPPPPEAWHSPLPHEPHGVQPPVVHGGLVVVVVVVGAVVVVELVGTGAQIICGVVTGSERFPNWSAKLRVAAGPLRRLTLLPHNRVGDARSGARKDVESYPRTQSASTATASPGGLA